METESGKLTGRTASRYDRGMSETAVLDKPKGLDVHDPQIVAKWKPILQDANSAVRDYIFKKIEKNEEPEEEDLDKDKLNKKAQEEIDKKFKEMTSHPEVRRPDDLYKIDLMLKGYQETTERAMKELGNDSRPKGDVLRKEVSWEQKYGWSDADRERIGKDLKNVLYKLKLDDKQTGIIMEVLLAKGMKPPQITESVLREKLQKATLYLSKDYAPDPDDKDYLNQSQLRDAHYDPEIVALVLLGVDQKQIQHHILTDEYNKDNDQELFYSPGPQNIEELAWQIMQTPGKRYDGWGVKGDFPLLEMRIVKHEKDDPNGKYKKGDIDTEKSGYRVNTANMVRWARYGMFVDYDRDREDPKDFFQSISLQGRYPLSFNQMLLNPTQYFRSEDGTDYKLLMLEWYKEAAVFSTVRSWDVAYRLVAGDSEELKKVFREMYNTKNLLTRNALGANIMNLMTTMPLDFEGRKDGHWDSDSTMGAAWIDIYRAYDSMSDYEGLRKILGPGSQFFNIKGWEQAILEIAGENIGVTGVTNLKVFMKKQGYKYFDAAFDDNGEITTADNRRNFIKFINIFGDKMIGGKLEWTVRAALRGAIAEKYGKQVYVKGQDGKVIEQVVDKVDKKGRDIFTRFPNAEVIPGDLGDKVKIRFKKYAFVSDEGAERSDDILKRVEDTDSLKLAEAIAWSLVKPFGAGAKNDPDGVGHDWMARPYNTELMRSKYTYRGDKQGNALNVKAFKRTAIDVLNGIVTESYVDVLDENGNKTYKTEEDRKKGNHITRERTPMEIFIELSEYKTVATKQLRELERQLEGMDPASDEAKRKREEIQKFSLESNKRYQNIAQNMSFTQRTLSNYYEDHLSFGIDLFKDLVDAKEIEWEKFTSFDVFGGARFKQQEFQKEVQSELIHKVRYMIDTYPSLNFNQTVRVMDQTATHNRHWLGDNWDGNKRAGEPVYHEVKLGEAMFGHELLNRPKFWKRDEKGKPINKVDKKGRKLKGLYEIDYQKVQDNKQDVWKQWVMMKIAADMYSHRALHENDVRYNFTYYQNALDALAKIPKEIYQDEYGFKDTISHDGFFDKKDMAWLKNAARVESFDLYWRAVLKDLFMDDKAQEGIGLLLALSLAMKAITEQKV